MRKCTGRKCLDWGRNEEIGAQITVKKKKKLTRHLLLPPLPRLYFPCCSTPILTSQFLLLRATEQLGMGARKPEYEKRSQGRQRGEESKT